MITQQELSEEEKKAVTRRVDLRIIPFLSVLYFFSFLDRVNVGNVHASMNQDLNLSETEFALVVGVFFIGYIAFELPSNLLMKRATPSRWLARIIFLWGIICVCLAFAQTFGALVVTRLFLGIAEAGFFPGVAYYLTLWYPNNKLAMRIALFYVSATLAGAFGGLFAYFILSYMEGFAGLKAYRWVFILEGIPSIILGAITWFYLPNSPKSASFLTAEEKDYIISQLEESKQDLLQKHEEMAGENQTLLEDYKQYEYRSDSTEYQFMDNDFRNDMTDYGIEEKGSCHKFLSHFFHIPTLISTITSPFVWYFSWFLYFPTVTCLYCSAFFLPALLGGLGLSIVNSNLMTVPLYLCAGVSTIFFSWRSDVSNERSNLLVFTSLIGAIGFLGLSFIGDRDSGLLFWISYILTGLTLIGVYPCVPITLSWLTNGVTSDIANLLARASPEDQSMVKATYTATQTAIVVSVGNLGGIIGPLVYSQSLKHLQHYRIGHLVMGILCIIVAVFSFIANRSFCSRILQTR